ncbi:MAG: hypothetical protein ABFQ62_01955 [Patescibacteria group bacterium]
MIPGETEVVAEEPSSAPAKSAESPTDAAESQPATENAADTAEAPEAGEEANDPVDEQGEQGGAPEADSETKSTALGLLQEFGAIEDAAVEEYSQMAEDELLDDLIDWSEASDDPDTRAKVKEVLIAKLSFDVPVGETGAAAEATEEVQAFLEKASAKDLKIMSEGLPIFERLKEFSQATVEAEDAAAGSVKTGEGGDIEIDPDHLEKIQDDLEKEPKLVRALTVVANLNKGSSMARFIDAFFTGPKDFSGGAGSLGQESEAGLSLLKKKDFENALKKPGEFAKKFEEALDDSSEMQGVLKFSTEDKKTLEKAKAGDVKALKKFLEVFVTNLFASGTQEEIEKDWKVIAKDLGDKMKTGHQLSRENLTWFYDIYQNNDKWSKYLPSS